MQPPVQCGHGVSTRSEWAGLSSVGLSSAGLSSAGLSSVGRGISPEVSGRASASAEGVEDRTEGSRLLKGSEPACQVLDLRSVGLSSVAEAVLV